MQEPNIQEVLCRVLGRPLEGDVTPAHAFEVLTQLDNRPWWLATVAMMLLEHVAQGAGEDETLAELAKVASRAAAAVERAVD